MHTTYSESKCVQSAGIFTSFCLLADGHNIEDLADLSPVVLLTGAPLFMSALVFRLFLSPFSYLHEIY